MPNIQNRHEQHCGVCGQPLNEEQQTLDAQEIAFMGAAAYAWCPSCSRQVAGPWDATYKVRWANAFSEWCRSQQMRAARQPKARLLRLLSPAGQVIDLQLIPTEADFELSWRQDGELQAVERFASRESGEFRLQELERSLRAHGYRKDGEPAGSSHSMRPTSLWTITTTDGRQARATLIPMGQTVSLAWFFDDKLEDLQDCTDCDEALRRAEVLRLMLTRGRRES